MRPGRAAALALAAGLTTAACGASAGSPPSATSSPAARSSPAATSSAPATPTGPAAAPVPAASSVVMLSVPPGEGGGDLAVRRYLRLPAGWTARVWARVPGARMEAWTPGGGLLVSQPGEGRVVLLTPGPGGTGTARTLLSGLTSPQGLAFGRVAGQWVLYVAQSDQIDRYRWNAGRVSGTPSVIAGHLPDLDPAGDDVHREKDVAVAPGGTVYFNVGSSSNASPADRTSPPPRATIEAVAPGGGAPRIAETGVRNGEGLAVAPDGTVWTAVNNRDNIPYPFHGAYGSIPDAFGRVIQAYVSQHTPDEIVPVTSGRDLGWPYCNPDQDDSHPAGSLADIPFVADAVANPRPADAVPGPDGALYVSDDTAGAIYRLMPPG